MSVAPPNDEGVGAGNPEHEQSFWLVITVLLCPQPVSSLTTSTRKSALAENTDPERAQILRVHATDSNASFSSSLHAELPTRSRRSCSISADASLICSAYS